MPKKLLFLTGTRADFGKIKSLIRILEDRPEFEITLFVTGMHTLERYGQTVDEVKKARFKNAKIHVFMNQIMNEPMDMILANTIQGLSRYIHQEKPDLIVVHGDRVEALAGAIVGSLQNILVAHLEGGELSGTVDEIIRHAVSKLSHLHFVANQEAKTRLIQLGEPQGSIFVIGSPDIDVMNSNTLPSLEEVKRYYGIPFEQFGVVLHHPVTTELSLTKKHAEAMVNATLESGLNYVVIYPNNDEGSHFIFEAYESYEGNNRFKVFPSLRFEYFLTLIKYAQFMIGNSSAGIREAPYYGLPSINIGSRQNNRFIHNSIIQVRPIKEDILEAIQRALHQEKTPPTDHFGSGNSAEQFLDVISLESTWNIPKQKQFNDILDAHAFTQS